MEVVQVIFILFSDSIVNLRHKLFDIWDNAGELIVINCILSSRRYGCLRLAAVAAGSVLVTLAHSIIMENLRLLCSELGLKPSNLPLLLLLLVDKLKWYVALLGVLKQLLGLWLCVARIREQLLQGSLWIWKRILLDRVGFVFGDSFGHLKRYVLIAREEWLRLNL